ncbi:RNA methyltransferase [Reinekea sp.]|jgi:tRNA (cytidine32/uridine32-2'-O)-methyltransferase|uniref:RNA methyltransferase n=1 Tax=Reinekea sp. TaxID=1970455 RepID=UPI002A81E9DE|nr:RNA methyltransferase [Reinekea sp.]
MTEPDSEMTFPNLQQVRVVMVHTSHPGNIGAAARAMKTMGFRHLVLVQPRDFPSATATAMASGATDLLDGAVVVETLQEAIADCGLVVGASARSRTLPWPLVNPREMAQQVLSMPDNSQVALVLGRERSGLTNDELACCHCHVNIPANPDYSSLNVASAVQVLTYELRMSCQAGQEKPKPHWGVPWDQPPANAGQLESLFQHWERVLVDIDFLNPNNPRTLMSKVRRLILRAHPDEVEANILRGMLSHVDKHLRKP